MGARGQQTRESSWFKVMSCSEPDLQPGGVLVMGSLTVCSQGEERVQGA